MSMVHVAGNAALDFVGTLSERGTADHEGLVSTMALASWYVEAGIVDRPPRIDDSHLAQAIQLREHVHALVRALVDGTPLPKGGRVALNRIARRPGPVQTLAPDGRKVRKGDADASLAAVAHAAVELFDRTDGAVVRFCGDDHCTHPFLDRSRNGRRRWCDMGTCGDRAKVRRYRGRTST